MFTYVDSLAEWNGEVCEAQSCLCRLSVSVILIDIFDDGVLSQLSEAVFLSYCFYLFI